MVELTNSDLLAIEREYCKRSLANFVKQAWHIVEPATPLAWGWVLDCICEHLEAVTRGDIKRLVANVPPGSMKSLLFNVFWPAWEWGAMGMGWTRHLHTSHKQDLAVRDTLKCRRLIQSAWYRSLWDVKLTGDQNAKTKFENSSTGFIEAMAFTSMTGARGDRVHLDDPHSVDDANSNAKRMAAITTFREALPSRVNNANSAIVIIMQRLHVEDVTAVALEVGYQHLCIPMRYEEGRSCFVLPNWSDPRKTEGELMFPERFSEQQVCELEATLGTYAVAGQLQQRPSPRGGGLIRSSWFGRYSLPPKIKFKMVFADTAQKTAERHDYSVFECWGFGDDGYLYLLDMMRGKWEAHELKQRAVDFWGKHFEARKMCVEDKASGTGLIQDLRRDRKIPIFPVQRNKDKYARVMDVIPYIEAGYIKIPESAPWVSDFISECEAFTADDSHAHDDQIDPMCDAIEFMLRNPVKDTQTQAKPVAYRGRW